MTKEYRKIVKLQIFRQVYTHCCNEEIEKQNKKYTMNIIFYKKKIPCDIVKFPINKY